MRLLTLFLSGDKSLTWWEAEGVFSREILVYRELLATGAFDRIQVFSYDAADRAFVARAAEREPLYQRLDVLAPDYGRARPDWPMRGVWQHRRAIGQSAIIKTNQVSGSAAATLAARLTGVPLVFRMGYRLSRRLALNGDAAKAKIAAAIEWAGARTAKAVVVTSTNVANDFRADPAVSDKVRLLPTYVDTTVFRPAAPPVDDGSVIAVGRFTEQKNLGALVEACALTGQRLTLVGKGPQEGALRALAERTGAAVEFAGTLDNVALADILREHTVFALPSLHEGLPKALIEAMASGLACVGTATGGVTDLIQDGVTGALCRGFSSEDVAEGLRRVAAGPAPLRRAARARIEADFSLPAYVAAARAIYEEIG